MVWQQVYAISLHATDISIVPLLIQLIDEPVLGIAVSSPSAVTI
jgi:hypothetical protein